MTTTIVTAFSDTGYVQYGHRFMATYAKHGQGIPLQLYTENVPDLPDCTQFDQLAIPGLSEFLQICTGDPLYQGRVPTAAWRRKDIRGGYSYRTDVQKFCKMVYSIHAGAHSVTTDNMIWLDGDTVVCQDVPPDIADQSLRGASYAFLGRKNKYSETGYVAFKLPEALPLIDSWVAYYQSGSFYREREWHSAWLFDRAREQHPDIAGHNLTPGCEGHVIHQCWVGKYFDHTKGDRKVKGRSPEAR